MNWSNDNSIFYTSDSVTSSNRTLYCQWVFTASVFIKNDSLILLNIYGLEMLNQILMQIDKNIIVCVLSFFNVIFLKGNWKEWYSNCCLLC